MGCFAGRGSGSGAAIGGGGRSASGRSERISISLNGQRSGFYHDRTGALVAFHATPGYETYRGLGWYGVIVCGA